MGDKNPVFEHAAVMFNIYVIDDRVPTCMWHVTHGRCAMASDEADPFKKKIKSMAATTNICSYS